MKKIWITATFVFVLGLMLILNITLHNIVLLKTPVASASVDPSANQTNLTSSSKLTPNSTANALNNSTDAIANATDAIANATDAIQRATENISQQATPHISTPIARAVAIPQFGFVVTQSTIAVAVMLILPLLAGMLIIYLQGRRTPDRGYTHPFSMSQLYRLLVAIGVIFAVLLIIIFLHSMVGLFIAIGADPSFVTPLIEIQKNFLTITGTAFASLVAFYFGTRSSQRSNSQGMTAITKPEAGQKALEVIDVNPIDGSIGVEVESPVTATFSAPVRSSTINPNTFSVKDANGNPVQGKITLTDNNTTIKFNPISPLKRNTRYTVTITKGLMDKSGASMSADKEWHFTTLEEA